MKIDDRLMRQHKNELCREMYGKADSRMLDTRQRLNLARVLLTQYNSSRKQVAKLCGLKYGEVKNML